MADKYKQILQELCGTALNFPAGELQTLLAKTDDDLSDDDVKSIGDTIKTRYRDTVTQINKTADLKLNDKFKAGQRNKAEEFEKTLREKFNVDPDGEKTGNDLIEEIATSQAQAASKTGKLTEEEIKKHPVYLKAETDLRKELTKLKEDHKKEVDTLQAGYTKKETQEKVNKKALELFEAMNPVLSEDSAKATAQKNILLNQLAAYDYEEVEGVYHPMKDGNRVEDEFKHAIDLEKLVKQVATPIFDFKVAQERKSPNGKDLKPGDPGYVPPKETVSEYKGKMPANEAEWRSMMEDEKIPIKDKQAINEHWDKAQSAAAK